MKTLLRKVREHLSSRIGSLKDIYVVQDPQRYPRTVDFPFMILSDGGEVAGAAAGGRTDTLTVDINIVTKVFSNLAEDTSMVGDGIEPGLLDLYEDVKDELETLEFQEESGEHYHRPVFISSDPSAVLDIDESSHMMVKHLSFSWRKFTQYKR